MLNVVVVDVFFSSIKKMKINLQQPGKLNLKNFAIVNEAIARMTVNSDTNLPEGDDKHFRVHKKKGSMFYDHAPLAAPEDDSDDLAEYAQIKDPYGGGSSGVGGGVGGGGVGITASGGGGGPNDPIMYPFAPHDSTPNKSKTTARHRRDNNKSLQSNVFVFRFNTTDMATRSL